MFLLKMVIFVEVSIVNIKLLPCLITIWLFYSDFTPPKGLAASVTKVGSLIVAFNLNDFFSFCIIGGAYYLNAFDIHRFFFQSNTDSPVVYNPEIYGFNMFFPQYYCTCLLFPLQLKKTDSSKPYFLFIFLR